MTLNLKSLYRQATRGLPQDADLRVTNDELLRLAAGESLGARQDAALQGLIHSSDQALAARIAMATQDWSQALADDLAQLRRPSLGSRISAWFRAATLPPVFAACAISLLAVAAWRIGQPEAVMSPGISLAHVPAAVQDDVLFDGDFDAVPMQVSNEAVSDELFGGDFDS